MNARNLLFSAAHFFVIFVIFGLGAFILALPYADTFRINLINVLLNPSDHFFYVGGGILAFGLILFFLLFALNRCRYFQIEMKGGVIAVEEKVIRDCVVTYFQDMFPEKEMVREVVIKGKSMIELFVNHVSYEKEPFFEQIEEDLGELLARKLGYQGSFSLTFVET